MPETYVHTIYDDFPRPSLADVRPPQQLESNVKSYSMEDFDTAIGGKAGQDRRITYIERTLATEEGRLERLQNLYRYKLDEHQDYRETLEANKAVGGNRMDFSAADRQLALMRGMLEQTAKEASQARQDVEVLKGLLAEAKVLELPKDTYRFYGD